MFAKPCFLQEDYVRGARERVNVSEHAMHASACLFVAVVGRERGNVVGGDRKREDGRKQRFDSVRARVLEVDVGVSVVGFEEREVFGQGGGDEA